MLQQRRNQLLLVLAAALPLNAGAAIIPLEATLDGDQADTDSTATGLANMQYDTDTNLFDFDLTVSGLTLDDLLFVGPNETPVHIHLGEVGEFGGIIVDLGFLSADGFQETGDDIALTIDDGTIDPDQQGDLDVDLTLAEVEDALLTDGTYVNLHSEEFPPGEIRGQLTTTQQVDVPAPLPLALMAAGLMGLGIVRRRR